MAGPERLAAMPPFTRHFGGLTGRFKPFAGNFEMAACATSINHYQPWAFLSSQLPSQKDKPIPPPAALDSSCQYIE